MERWGTKLTRFIVWIWTPTSGPRATRPAVQANQRIVDSWTGIDLSLATATLK